MRRTIPFVLGLMVLLAFGQSVATAQEATQEATKPVVVPHDLEGKDNCLMCHKTGVMEAPVIPESHADRTNEMCLLCHAEDSVMQTGVPTAIPHDLEGKDNCLMCHKTGVMEAPVAPESHAGMANDACGMCHEPAG